MINSWLDGERIRQPWLTNQQNGVRYTHWLTDFADISRKSTRTIICRFNRLNSRFNEPVIHSNCTVSTAFNVAKPVRVQPLTAAEQYRVDQSRGRFGEHSDMLLQGRSLLAVTGRVQRAGGQVQSKRIRSSTAAKPHLLATPQPRGPQPQSDQKAC